MPIHETDPWREQYFEGVPCPDDVDVPCDDGDAWQWYPKHRWVYNKLLVAESQGFICAPHGISPKMFPVFSKPVFNMRGMGTGSRAFENETDYKAFQQPGHFWMPMMEGEHVSTDVAVVNGDVTWQRHTTGEALSDGMFDYWTVLADTKPALETYLSDWVAANLPDYTGMLNFETIGGKIIEVHLRFADQWPDLYGGRPWVEALIRLYAEKVWDFDDSNRRTGYSVVLFGAHGIQYPHPPADMLADLRATPGIESIQVTFHENRPAEWHAMPPGGFRLAIVNSYDYELAVRTREKLALGFWSTQQLKPDTAKVAGSQSG